MLKIMPITTAIMPWFIYSFMIFNDCISIVRLQPVVLYIMLCCSALIFYTLAMLRVMLMRKLVPHFASNCHDYYITNKDCYRKSDDQNIYKLTDNDYFVVVLFISQILPIILVLCLMLSTTYYAQNYGGIIGLCLLIISNQ